MSRLAIFVDVPDDRADPALVDPHEIAEDVVDFYNDEIGHGYTGPPITFVAAEWQT